MKRAFFKTFLITLLMLTPISLAWAHFGVIIPSDDIVSKEDSKKIELQVKFIHPFEGHYMEMARPKAFGVMVNGKKHDLLPTLKKKTVKGFSTWEATYRIRRPGDHVFYVEPAPYWEPAEESFIIHYSKVIVDALTLETGWDAEIGLKTEIVPLTRPYGLWAGNVFQGIVKVDGKPVPHSEVEVEYYNEGGKIKPPAEPYITQVVKADKNGVFTYAMPIAGWWGFAALNTADFRLKHKGKEYPVEIGAVIWVKTREMK
ncbi:Additional periplasmic component NikK of nickel ECF transporter [hydrothermal vent metagenome]|uniref:Additional periplasmic component NikK of nickel ECF transporter n=1 Tax=hydrothermal vent metagenome TaxID=652676 RepID=A0A3B1CNS4_9ZZZZ